MWTISSGFLNGNGRSRTVSITLKIALFAPMPRARVRIAMTAKAGALISIRKAYLRSVIIKKAPNPKLQIRKELQIPNSNHPIQGFPLELGAWDFFGTWDLGFAIFYKKKQTPRVLDDCFLCYAGA